MRENRDGAIMTRTFTLEAVCQENEGHKHNYDHTTIVIRGRIKVFYAYEKDGQRVEGESREYAQGEQFTVKADVYHRIKSLEPNSMYACCFAHRDFDGLVTQVYTGNEAAYV